MSKSSNSLHPSNISDFLIIGAGIIGVSIALQLRSRFPDSKIIILEKEKNCGEHASGRNSGVLHAGVYYPKDSFKARFTKEGNELLTQYCLERKLPINRCGKLIVARDEQDLPGLIELAKRSHENNIEVNEIDLYEARQIEDKAKTFERAIFVPSTSTVNPKLVLESLARDAIAQRIGIHFATEYRQVVDNNDHLTNKGRYTAKYLINCAGLYADKIALQHGFSKEYRILPFKGLYLYANPNSLSLRTHIYPVPDLNKPFLGTHFTITIDGQVKIGPTAIPAFWREHYSGLTNFKLSESLEILYREAGLFLRSEFGFRKLAIDELKKYSQTYLVKQAAKLADGVKLADFRQWGKPGIRAQLCNTKTGKLEMDFVLEGDEQSFHVLNAVSPAFTCSMPFARHVVSNISSLISG